MLERTLERFGDFGCFDGVRSKVRLIYYGGNGCGEEGIPPIVSRKPGQALLHFLKRDSKEGTQTLEFFLFFFYFGFERPRTNQCG